MLLEETWKNGGIETRGRPRQLMFVADDYWESWKKKPYNESCG